MGKQEKPISAAEYKLLAGKGKTKPVVSAGERVAREQRKREDLAEQKSAPEGLPIYQLVHEALNNGGFIEIEGSKMTVAYNGQVIILTAERQKPL